MKITQNNGGARSRACAKNLALLGYTLWHVKTPGRNWAIDGNGEIHYRRDLNEVANWIRHERIRQGGA